MVRDVKRPQSLWGRVVGFCTQAKTLAGAAAAVLTMCALVWGYWQSYRTGLMDAGAAAEKEKQRNQAVETRLAAVESKVDAADNKLSTVNSKLDLLIQLNGAPVPVANRHRLQISPFAESEAVGRDVR